LTSILDRGNSQLHASAAVSPRERTPLYPLDRRLSGLQSWSGRYGEKRNLMLLPGIELRQSSLYLIAIPIELSRKIREYTNIKTRLKETA
jgi:hypothetical protein